MNLQVTVADPGDGPAPPPPPLYFRPRYLFVTDVNLLLRDSINLQVYPYIKCTSSCQTLHEGFYLQVEHKYSVLPSQRYQAPSERFHLQVKNKHLLLRDSMLTILRCCSPMLSLLKDFSFLRNRGV